MSRTHYKIFDTQISRDMTSSQENSQSADANPETIQMGYFVY